MTHRTMLAVLAVAILSFGAASTRAGVTAQIERLSDYTRYSVTLPEALPGGHDVTLHLGHQGDRFRQGWAQVNRTGHLAEHVDMAALRLRDGRLRGEVELWVAVERGGPLYRAVYELDVPIDGAQVKGAYTGRYSVRTDSLVYDTDEMVVRPHQVRPFAYGDPVEGGIEGEVQAPAVDSKPARFELESGHLLLGDLSVTRYVILRFDIDGDRVSNISMVPRSPGSATWRAEVEQAELAFEGGQLHGSIKVNVSGGGPRTRDGHYTFELRAQVSDNEVVGRFANGRLRDENIGGAALSGFAKGLRDSADVRLYALSLPRAIESRGGRDGLLGINLRYADGRFRDGVAMCPRFPHRFDVDVDRLRIDGGRLRGALSVHFTPDSPVIASPEPFTVEYRIDATVDAQGVIAGAYACAFGPVRRVEGTTALRVRRADELRRAEALRAGLDWPAWNGPNGNFAATPSGRELVDRLEDARLVWASEHTPPGRCQTMRYGQRNVSRYLTRGGPAGGGSSPVVADGLVYQYYFRPAGSRLPDYVQQQAEEGNRVLGAEMWALDGEDVVLAMDAATGQTVWKAVVPGGRYHTWRGTGHAKGAYTAKVAVGGGNVYLHGTGNRTMALDAKTGEMRWNNNNGGLHVVALEDMAVFSGDHITALDAKTGEVRWRIVNAGHEAAAPLHWRYNGRSYIISGNVDGRVVCVDAATGEIQWELTDVGNNSRTMTLAGDRNMLLLNLDPDRRAERCQLAAYRISARAAERAWELPEEHTYNPHRGRTPIVHGDAVYLFEGRFGENMLVLDLMTGRILQTVRVGRSTSGHVQWFDDRLILQTDASHSRTSLRYFRATGNRVEPLGDLWSPPHRTTSSYYPMLTTHAIADGRIFIRGSHGIYAYDLRAE
ncbi:MAG: PQQ-binding-like beta-propeller repeat protein [Phycisphaeraceae bacterium]|nr:PQQ-binding-like beta-propeller repeat protein [Phycisphaeraceae bacterium]